MENCSSKDTAEMTSHRLGGKKTPDKTYTRNVSNKQTNKQTKGPVKWQKM